MKTDNQPQHTQAQKWKIQGNRLSENRDIVMIETGAFIARCSFSSDAQTIVKCCNNEWKIDMHEELVKELKKLIEVFEPFSKEAQYVSGLFMAKQLLKQAEQK